MIILFSHRERPESVFAPDELHRRLFFPTPNAVTPPARSGFPVLGSRSMLLDLLFLPPASRRAKNALAASAPPGRPSSPAPATTTSYPSFSQTPPPTYPSSASRAARIAARFAAFLLSFSLRVSVVSFCTGRAKCRSATAFTTSSSMSSTSSSEASSFEAFRVVALSSARDATRSARRRLALSPAVLRAVTSRLRVASTASLPCARREMCGERGWVSACAASRVGGESAHHARRRRRPGRWRWRGVANGETRG